MTGRLDEIHTGMYAVVDDIHAVELVLGFEICIESLLDIFDDWAPGVIVVDEIAEARRIYYGQA